MFITIFTQLSFNVCEWGWGPGYSVIWKHSSGAGTAYPSGAPKFTPVLVVFALLDLYVQIL
jgi:hypothetical protein